MMGYAELGIAGEAEVRKGDEKTGKERKRRERGGIKSEQSAKTVKLHRKTKSCNIGGSCTK
jgi:hypothetical protein